jgi:Zn-dependent protease with chaperone function
MRSAKALPIVSILRDSDAMGGMAAVQAIFFDGRTNKRYAVEIALGQQLAIVEDGETIATWAFKDIRAADAAPGRVRFANVSGSSLARLDLADGSQEALEILTRCPQLGHAYAGEGGTWRIVFWSLAAATSILLLVFFGVPYAADIIAPIVPPFLEKRIGGMAERQITALFGDKICNNAEGKAAFQKLVQKVAVAGGLDIRLDAEILSVRVPNAMALPGGKVYLFSGMLRRANDPDEIAGVIGHELGHVHNHDGMRRLIASGGSSFLLGLLFGDVSGSGAAIFATQSLVSAAYSRDVEARADGFAISAMHALGRSPEPMGQLLFRITGAQGAGSMSILAGHPLTEDRLERMKREAKPDDGPPILSPEEWQALKKSCEN